MTFTVGVVTAALERAGTVAVATSAGAVQAALKAAVVASAYEAPSLVCVSAGDTVVIVVPAGADWLVQLEPLKYRMVPPDPTAQYVLPEPAMPLSRNVVAVSAPALQGPVVAQFAVQRMKTLEPGTTGSPTAPTVFWPTTATPYRSVLEPVVCRVKDEVNDVAAYTLPPVPTA